MILTLALTFLRRFGIQLALAAAIVGAGWWALSAAEQRGWDRRDAQAQLEARQALDEANRIVRENIADAAARDQAAAATIDKLNAVAAGRAKTLNEHLAAQELTPQGNPHDALSGGQPTAAQPAVAHRPLLGHAVLDAFTVRVLNDARANAAGPAPGGAPAGADAEGQAAAFAPTTITGRDFADNDLEVVRLYHELATRHDGLVDWVNRQCVPEPGPFPPTH